jgi:hypothetical protein
MGKNDELLMALHEKGISVMTVADSADKYISEAVTKYFGIKCIADVRSASFYALGITQTLCKPTIILVESVYLDHAYTGLVEAWFQQVPLVVVVIDAADKMDYGIYNRYLNRIIDFRNGVGPFDVSCDGPVLMIVDGGRQEESCVDVSGVAALLPVGVRLYLPESKYGALSKYMGYLCGTEETVYCAVPLSWLRYDLNIFNNRYIDNRFKLIAVDDINMDYELGKWLNANNIRLMKGDWDQGLSALVSATEPMLYVIKY